jgi:hypothetical protein
VLLLLLLPGAALLRWGRSTLLPIEWNLGLRCWELSGHLPGLVLHSSSPYCSGPLLLRWAWEVNGRGAVLLLCLAAAAGASRGLQSWSPSEAQRLVPVDA